MINKKKFIPCIRSLFTDNIPQNGNMDLSNADPSLIFYAPFKSNLGYWTKDSGWDDASFARTSSQTYISPVNRILRIAPANTPAIGRYGVELQGATTNLIPYSYAWGSWIKNGLPDISGSLITDNSDAVSQYILVNLALNTNTTYSISFVVNLIDSGNNYSRIAISTPDKVVRVVINPRTGDVTNSSNLDDHSTKVIYPSQVLVKASFTTGSTSGNSTFYIVPAGNTTGAAADSEPSALGSLDIAWIQLETGSVATAYTPTNGTAATTTTSAADTSGNGLQVDLTPAMIDCFGNGGSGTGVGTLIQLVELPYASSAIKNDVIIKLITPYTDNIVGINRRSTGTLQIPRFFDGVSGSGNTVSEIPAGRYVIILQWSSVLGKMCGGLYNIATKSLIWSHSTIASGAPFRGYFPIHSSNKLRWFYGGTLPLGIGGCALYDTILTDDEIIRAVQALQ